jgi:hypothetical protein
MQKAGRLKVHNFSYSSELITDAMGSLQVHDYSNKISC